MKFQPLQRSKNVQRFRALSKKLGTMVDNGSFYELNQEKQVSLRSRLVKLYRTVGAGFSKSQLRNTLASAAIVLSMAGMAQAQTFAPPVTADFGLTNEGTPILHFADIDNDGDQDAFMSIYNADYERVFAFQENEGTAEAASFGAVQENGLNITSPGLVLNVDLADVDVDGDLDLFVGSYNFYGPAAIYGWENTGTAEAANFNLTPATDPFNLQPSQGIAEVVFVDLDGDSDPDVISNDYIDSDSYEQFRYQENLGIQGTFPTYEAPVTDPFGLDNQNLDRIIIDAVDIDGDGDQDLMATGRNDIDDYLDTSFFYYENTGTSTSPAFAAVAENPFGLQVPANTYILIAAFVDMDGDGDTDVVASTRDTDTYEDGLLYWENLGMMSNTNEVTAISNSSVFPTVAQGEINWQAQLTETISNAQVKVYDLNSRLAFEDNQRLFTGDNQGTIVTTDFAKGMYVLQITDGQGNTLASHRFFVQ